MTSTTVRFAELHAPALWQVVDFISDLHLQASEAQTLQAWEQYLAQTSADAIIILGDLFEVWIGDDATDAGDAEAQFERHCLQRLQAAAAQRDICFMHGNRDFLFGPAAANRAGLHLLADPTVLDFGGQRWLLTHGDELCLDDRDYLQFRAQVRTPGWQQDFLARPLAERRAIARSLREQSEQRKRSDAPYADVDTAMASAWLHEANAATMIHGHTHRPVDHDLAPGLRRIVLSDWDLSAEPVRAQVLRLRRQAGGAVVDVRRLDLSQTG